MGSLRSYICATLSIILLGISASPSGGQNLPDYPLVEERTIRIDVVPVDNAALGFAPKQSTGFLVSEDGYILTVRHSLPEHLQNIELTVTGRERARRIIARQAKITGRIGGETVELEFVDSMHDNSSGELLDLALLRIKDLSPDDRYPYFRIGSSKYLFPGRFNLYGFSILDDEPNELKWLGLNHSGVCTDLEIICSAEGNKPKPGYSGGPVFRENNPAVIGLTVYGANIEGTAGSGQFLHVPRLLKRLQELSGDRIQSDTDDNKGDETIGAEEGNNRFTVVLQQRRPEGIVNLVGVQTYILEIGPRNRQSKPEVTDPIGEAHFGLPVPGNYRVFYYIGDDLYGCRTFDAVGPRVKIINTTDNCFLFSGRDRDLPGSGARVRKPKLSRISQAVAENLANTPVDLVQRKVHAPLGVPEASITLDRTAYSLGFDAELRLARWLAFELDATKQIEPVAFQRPSWRDDPELPEQLQTRQDSYRMNDFSRGALMGLQEARAGATDDEVTQRMAEARYYSAAVPQLDATLIGSWSGIRDITQNLSDELGPLYVISGPVFPDVNSDAKLITIGPERTVVPLSLFRILLRQDSLGEWKSIAFLVPNDGSSLGEIEGYVRSVQEIEQITGLTFFPELSDQSATKTKANKSLEEFVRLPSVG